MYLYNSEMGQEFVMREHMEQIHPYDPAYLCQISFQFYYIRNFLKFKV